MPAESLGGIVDGEDMDDAWSVMIQVAGKRKGQQLGKQTARPELRRRWICLDFLGFSRK
jgi:hypothetical protein